MAFHTLIMATGFSLFVALTVIVGTLALAFAAISKQRYPTHKTGAVVVTGASSGIGRHLSFTLAQNGYRVYAGVRSEDDAASLRAECGMDYRNNLVPVLLDVTKTNTIDDVVRVVSAELSSLGLPLVGLVNNAGVFYTAPLEFIDLDKTREVFEVNVLGVVAMTQRFVPLLRAHQGRVVNMGSIAGVMAPAFYSAYSGSKYALEALSDCLRLELAPWRVSVSLLQPGFIQTRLYEARQPLANVSEEQAHLYEPQMSFDMHKREQSIATSCSPAKVTALVLHALASPYPYTRYLAGTYNKRPIAVIRALAYLPDRIQDLLKLAPEVRRRLSVPTSLQMARSEAPTKPGPTSNVPDAAAPGDLDALTDRSKLIGTRTAR